MCTVSVKVNEDVLRDYLPELDTTAAIRLWVQELVDQRMQQMRNGFADQTTEEVYDAIEQRVKSRSHTEVLASAEHAIDVETMRERLHRMVHEVYSMPCAKHKGLKVEQRRFSSTAVRESQPSPDLPRGS